MNSTLSIKCIPYINSSKRNGIRGVYYVTQRFKSDDDNNSKKNQLAVEKLNNLLKTMKKGNDTEMPPQQSKPIELAQPRQLARKSEQNKQNIEASKQNKPLGEKLSDAATKVAQSIGGDTNKTKSDLLNLLRIYNNEPNDSSEKKVKSSVQLDDLLSGMKIDRSQSKKSAEFSDVDRAQRVRELLGHSSGEHQRTKKYRKPMDNYMPINLFSSEPLGIFKNFDTKKDIPTLPTWDRLYEKSLQTAVTHPPKNIYEQMIIWTEQGKLWKFPINNEQGMDDENNVFFAEHVFLEPLIDEWCPKKGPIRHFMELVCVGLSKNPFLSVEEKKDHLNWFRQYFYEKNQLLSEVGAFEIKSLPENVKEYYKPTIPDE
ncbi:small ribosomal subunit protein mS31 [Metopolophium dirhodum]|uniref:small ribosomal subunit protein mS31 n=1 Tax=Metopolophium dirhodum TaxID=44670 RepID=UPI00299048F2|nr:small ribosomal subunit protein mS31 [Metopolophium dirhodum]XP_060880066.1 small ribosomal subunit protein mS31 [Metopolophium dirhodum]